MKPLKEKDRRDLKIDILEGKTRYMIQAMEFRRRILEQKTSDLRKKKKLY